ncbi:hypothetical protein GBA52_016511 [Prunus armeniaca]|nr:hypothetical protein GBA52_016511 [Prunus armeniaca]
MKVDRNSPLERNLSPTQVFNLVMVVGSTFYLSSKPQSSDLRSLHTKLSLRNEDDTQEKYVVLETLLLGLILACLRKRFDAFSYFLLTFARLKTLGRKIS